MTEAGPAGTGRTGGRFWVSHGQVRTRRPSEPLETVGKLRQPVGTVPPAVLGTVVQREKVQSWGEQAVLPNEGEAQLRAPTPTLHAEAASADPWRLHTHQGAGALGCSRLPRAPGLQWGLPFPPPPLQGGGVSAPPARLVVTVAGPSCRGVAVPLLHDCPREGLHQHHLLHT